MRDAVEFRALIPSVGRFEGDTQGIEGGFELGPAETAADDSPRLVVYADAVAYVSVTLRSVILGWLEG